MIRSIASPSVSKEGANDRIFGGKAVLGHGNALHVLLFLLPRLAAAGSILLRHVEA